MLEIVNNIQRQNKFYSDEYTNEEMDDVLLDFGYSASSDSKEEKGKKLFNGLNKLPTILDESENNLNDNLNIEQSNLESSNSNSSSAGPSDSSEREDKEINNLEKDEKGKGKSI